ncbi:WD repeat protein [Ophiocordyceps camponoti-floridani]|uniref:Probable cytosolic iron-sulfur protein assembly protein 1 n=1 Tax=Ophiocordyceps camponoti-floridani TaxID=2030778 RepID=A0A8H4Q6G1_9HYPO|nr:WD repeat protein [Ophiocordyceps camponoti-floridani]
MATQESLAAKISFLNHLEPDLHERAWASIPHPSLPLLATAHARGVTVFSLATLTSHSSLTGGHTRSVRSVAWEPGLPSYKLCLVTGSFDSTAGLWRLDVDEKSGMETEVVAIGRRDGRGSDSGQQEWDFALVLEGHESEVKSCSFSPSGAYLATCSRDKTVWIWEDIGRSAGAEDEWETQAILNEHEGDVKAVAWCPDVPGRNARRRYSPDVLASASYDNTARIWREDADAEWVCVSVLEGHDGTVWGVEWETKTTPSDRFPRLLTFSSDATVRIWAVEEDVGDDGDEAQELSGALGRIPNTMRASLRETWNCTAILPRVHDGDIYAVAWSDESGLVASAGSDGTIAVYREASPSCQKDSTASGVSAVVTGEQRPSSTSWDLVATLPNAHGPYEINHITWCRRYDDAAGDGRGKEEMLVTTGDDGLIRMWSVIFEP